MSSKRLLVSTSAGTTFVSPTQLCVIINKGREEERFVSELKPGDITLFRKEGVGISLDELTSVLYEIPGYQEVRDFCYVRDDGYETTRLRYDLIKSIATSEPGLFLEEELTKLDEYIFRRNGLNFSEITYHNIVGYLARLLEENRIVHDLKTYKNWIDGKTIHPFNLHEAVKIGKIAGSEELERRARFICQTPRGQNPYFLLIDSHRILSSILARPKGKGTGRRRLERESRERVHRELPEWYPHLLKRVGPRIIEGIVDATIHDIRVVDTRSGRRSRKRVHTRLKRGLVSFTSSEDDRIEIYTKLGLSPSSRVSVLKTYLQEYVEIIEHVCMHLLPIIFDYFEETEYFVSDIVMTKAREVIITPLECLRHHLSPLFDHDSETIKSIYQYWKDIQEKSKIRKFRREYIRVLYKRLPRDSPIYNALSRVFDRSLLLQMLFDEVEHYIRVMTKMMRAVDSYILDESTRYKSRGENSSNVFMDICSRIHRSGSEYIELLPRIEEQIPEEITAFTAIPYAITRYDYYELWGTERNLLREILENYGIDYEWYADFFDQLVTKLGSEYERRFPVISELREIELIKLMEIKNRLHRIK